MTREEGEVVKIGDIAKVISGYVFKAKDFLTIGILVIKNIKKSVKYKLLSGDSGDTNKQNLLFG